VRVIEWRDSASFPGIRCAAWVSTVVAPPWVTTQGDNRQPTSAGQRWRPSYLRTFEIPTWVLLLAYLAIALGALSGGWRIVHTMGGRLTRLKPAAVFARRQARRRCFSPRTWGYGFPPPMRLRAPSWGVGSIQRMKAVRWGIATNIVWAWVLTIPVSAIIAYASFWVLHAAMGGVGRAATQTRLMGRQAGPTAQSPTRRTELWSDSSQQNCVIGCRPRFPPGSPVPGSPHERTPPRAVITSGSVRLRVPASVALADPPAASPVRF
jgi:hypothetical protein